MNRGQVDGKFARLQLIVTRQVLGRRRGQHCDSAIFLALCRCGSPV